MKEQYIWLTCEDCGKERRAKLQYKPIAQRCKSCANRMEHNPRWKGGRVIRRGYVEVKLHPKDFFYSMADKRGYIVEHRLVMAKHLGRCLLRWEIVHHKNGIKDDNRLENLELITDKRWHLVDSEAKRYMKQLEDKIEMLLVENRHLKEMLKNHAESSIQ